MNGAFKHPLRVGVRLVWLAGEMSWIALNYVPRVVLQSGCSQLVARARWLQWGCRRVLRIFQLKVTVTGPVPEKGLLVSNHLSYLDILILSALTPAVFVAKREVKHWPVFGLFARFAGTLFVDRQQRMQVGTSGRSIEALLFKGALVVLFPEGTSSDGKTVLPFKSALLGPVATGRHPLSASAIDYELHDGDVSEEICYWKSMILLPHVLNVLSKTGVTAHIRFSDVELAHASRKHLASRLHARVLQLKATHFKHPASRRELQRKVTFRTSNQLPRRYVVSTPGACCVHPGLTKVTVENP